MAETLSPVQKLATLDSDTLVWQELSRQTFLDHLNMGSLEEARAQFGDRMPVLGLKDLFAYQLNGATGLDITYKQSFFPTTPFALTQSLDVSFGVSNKPTHPLANDPAFPSLRAEQMHFVMGGYTDPHHVSLESQNLELHERAWGKNEFTPTGNEIMKALITYADRLHAAAGLEEDARDTLKQLLSSIRAQFAAGTLEPLHWQR